MDTDTRLTAAYQDHRVTLLAIAYRMTGSFADAEDIVQEAYVRFRRVLAGGAEPDSDRAYLSTVTTRICIDHLRSARVRREAYVGPWLPEPAVDGLTDLADGVVLADTVSMAFLVLLERLTPHQRAVFLLHDVMGMPHAEVAATVGVSEAASRQAVARARRAVRRARSSAASAGRGGPGGQGARRRLAERFFEAAREGDVEALLGLLAQDAEFVGDGGASGRGVHQVLHGALDVARAVTRLVRRLLALGGRLSPVTVGGEPAVLLLDPVGDLVAVWSLVVDGDRVSGVLGVVNPDKLGHLGLPTTAMAPASRSQAGDVGPTPPDPGAAAPS